MVKNLPANVRAQIQSLVEDPTCCRATKPVPRGWIPSKRNLSDTDSCPFPGERTAAAWRTHDEALHGEGHSRTRGPAWAVGADQC